MTKLTSAGDSNHGLGLEGNPPESNYVIHVGVLPLCFSSNAFTSGNTPSPRSNEWAALVSMVYLFEASKVPSVPFF